MDEVDKNNPYYYNFYPLNDLSKYQYLKGKIIKSGDNKYIVLGFSVREEIDPMQPFLETISFHEFQKRKEYKREENYSVRGKKNAVYCIILNFKEYNNPEINEINLSHVAASLVELNLEVSEEIRKENSPVGKIKNFFTNFLILLVLFWFISFIIGMSIMIGGMIFK